MKKIYDLTYKIVLLLCKFLLIVDIIIVSYSVCSRYIPNVPDPAWSEEIVLTCMAYMAVLSAALAIRRKAHIRMTAFDKYLPKKLLYALDVLSDIAVFALAIIMVVVGLEYAINIGSKGSYVSMPSVSRFWMYFPIPLAGFAMILFQIESLYYNVKLLFGKGEM
ncbi:C4-dicarboxylate ABC transporter permease [Candidatus Epulonipiscium fishelsonii]|nr:C4-dicarboxylate ABC transporter permease [Epulopiscium sp. SCG-B05WGA-EpuloA1]